MNRIKEVQNRIFTIRGLQVMLDSDLPEMYGVETRVLNQAVKRNIRRFPPHFMFQLTKEAFDDWNNSVLKSQTVISKTNSLKSQSVNLEKRGGRRKMPFAFTEQGLSMLSAVLKSDTAIDISIQIMNAFVEMRKFISTNAGIFQRLENVEQKQLATDEKFERLFKALEDKSLKALIEQDLQLYPNSKI